MSVRTVTVRLPEGLHRAVKVRCAERGDSFEGIARAAFVAYLGEGGLAAGAAGEPVSRDSGGAPRSAPATSSRCSREARHHINHSGKPCPECGWPTNGRAVT